MSKDNPSRSDIDYMLKFTELTDNSVSRREAFNQMFLFANGAILGIDRFVGSPEILAALGVGLCIIWIVIINYYKDLVRAKGKVIANFEEQFSLNLWTKFERNRSHKLWHSLAVIEVFLPVSFAFVYSLVTFNEIRNSTGKIFEAEMVVFFVLLFAFISILVPYFVHENRYRKMKATHPK